MSDRSRCARSSSSSSRMNSLLTSSGFVSGPSDMTCGDRGPDNMLPPGDLKRGRSCWLCGRANSEPPGVYIRWPSPGIALPLLPIAIPSPSSSDALAAPTAHCAPTCHATFATTPPSTAFTATSLFFSSAFAVSSAATSIDAQTSLTTPPSTCVTPSDIPASNCPLLEATVSVSSPRPLRCRWWLAPARGLSSDRNLCFAALVSVDFVRAGAPDAKSSSELVWRSVTDCPLALLPAMGSACSAAPFFALELTYLPVGFDFVRVAFPGDTSLVLLVLPNLSMGL
mmetsp:Transcript_31810/g.74944  ORF Transcript_31810/g.74944 Transcript_31810/m.74944 type:complete len:283 (-) Transcript_31810:564-1412(-)